MAPAPGNAPSPLRNAAFRAIWLASVFSFLGSWVQDVGESWLMLSMTPSPVLVALLTTSFAVPCMLLTLPSGLIADRLDRRKVLIWSQVLQAVTAGVLGVLTLLGVVHPYVLLLASAALGIGSALSGPPWQTLVPELLPRERTSETVTLNSIAFNIARALGPAIGGVVLASLGTASAFLLNAVSFGAVIWVLLRYREVREASERPRAAPQTREPLRKAILAPVPAVWRSARLRAPFVGIAAFSVGAAPIGALLSVFCKHSLHASATGYGVVLGCMGAGAILGGLRVQRLRSALGPRVVIAGGMALYGTSLGLAVLAHRLWPVAALMVPAGAGWLACLSTLNATCQLAAPEGLKSRVIALYQVTFMSTWALFAAVGGALAAHVGERGAMVVGALGVLVASAGAAASRLPDTEHALSAEFVPTPAPVPVRASTS